jgi:hypothetical protein
MFHARVSLSHRGARRSGYFIELDGDVHLSMYQKFEGELGELKRKEAIKNRARKRLESYLNEGGGLKAIR